MSCTNLYKTSIENVVVTYASHRALTCMCHIKKMVLTIFSPEKWPAQII